MLEVFKRHYYSSETDREVIHNEYFDGFERLFLQQQMLRRRLCVGKSWRRRFRKRRSRAPSMLPTFKRLDLSAPEVEIPEGPSIEEARLVRQCHRYLEEASSCAQPPVFVIEEVKGLLEKGEYKKLRRNRTGEWSDEEVEWLITHRKASLPLPSVCYLLRRTKNSV